MKKLFSLTLALIVYLGLTVPAFAANSDFVVENGILVKYNGKGGAVTIPSSAIVIDRSAFQNNKTVTSVTIPDSVTIIQPEAFSGCTGLTSVALGKGIRNLNTSIFSGCTGLTSVTIPDNVTFLGMQVFYGCTGLTDVAIPNGITRIHHMTFGRCTGLKSVAIPESVTAIDNYAFYCCTGLTIYGTAGSYAETYAKENNFKFEAVNSSAVHPQEPAGLEAIPTNDKLTVDGVPGNPTVFKIDGANYFKIRDLAALLNGTSKRFSVGYDNALKSVTATTGQGYTKLDTDLLGLPYGAEPIVEPSNDTIYIDGKKIDATVYKIEGSNYFKLRDLGKALNFYVGWTQADGVFIDTSKPYSE